jgi:regulator of protease activity HflC (stomatin/prohibitin superfamily)
MKQVNVTEKMMDIQEFEAITKERLNTTIDLVVFYKVREGEADVKKSLYKVDNFESQIVRMAQTTARNVIGEMNFEAVNSRRDILNNKLKDTLQLKASAWGVDIVTVETKQITPPEKVQNSMNEVLMAENEKQAAVNRATARETEADGVKRAKIKEAEGDKQSQILKAEGAAKAFDLVIKSFTGGAKELKQLEVVQNSLQNNAKIILGEDGKGILKLLDINK